MATNENEANTAAQALDMTLESQIEGEREVSDSSNSYGWKGALRILWTMLIDVAKIAIYCIVFDVISSWAYCLKYNIDLVEMWEDPFAQKWAALVMFLKVTNLLICTLVLYNKFHPPAQSQYKILREAWYKMLGRALPKTSRPTNAQRSMSLWVTDRNFPLRPTKIRKAACPPDPCTFDLCDGDIITTDSETDAEMEKAQVSLEKVKTRKKSTIKQKSLGSDNVEAEAESYEKRLPVKIDLKPKPPSVKPVKKAEKSIVQQFEQRKEEIKLEVTKKPVKEVEKDTVAATVGSPQQREIVPHKPSPTGDQLAGSGKLTFTEKMEKLKLMPKSKSSGPDLPLSTHKDVTQHSDFVLGMIGGPSGTWVHQDDKQWIIHERVKKIVNIESSRDQVLLTPEELECLERLRKGEKKGKSKETKESGMLQKLGQLISQDKDEKKDESGPGILGRLANMIPAWKREDASVKVTVTEEKTEVDLPAKSPGLLEKIGSLFRSKTKVELDISTVSEESEVSVSSVSTVSLFPSAKPKASRRIPLKNWLAFLFLILLGAATVIYLNPDLQDYLLWLWDQFQAYMEWLWDQFLLYAQLFWDKLLEFLFSEMGQVVIALAFLALAVKLYQGSREGPLSAKRTSILTSIKSLFREPSVHPTITKEPSKLPAMSTRIGDPSKPKESILLTYRESLTEDVWKQAQKAQIGKS